MRLCQGRTHQSVEIKLKHYMIGHVGALIVRHPGVHSQTHNKAQRLAACGHVSASSQ